uniref:SFRICE_030574 n=1 Tax=Spodoptera frugiperda TaxID=7108 RepID=A0A2H1WB20_SPOFR
MTDQKNMEVCGSVMDGVAEKGGVLESPTKKGATEYVVYPIRWLVLFVFVFNSASNSMQWIQYTIIQDAIVKYYDVTSIQVYWTSMIYMITYIPLIFPASFLLDKTDLGHSTVYPQQFFNASVYDTRHKTLAPAITLFPQLILKS